MKPLNERELEALYDDMLNECYPDCKIGPYEYSTARALSEVDPIAYRCGYADWLDAEIQDGRLFEKDEEYYSEDPNENEGGA